MKQLFIFLLMACSAVASATSYYISPNGNDSNNGTISSPFFTLNKAWSVVRAGDIIYARGGTYRFNSRQNLTGKNGTVSDTIRIWAYPGERPVFTKSSTFTIPSWPVCLIYIKADYLHIRGIEVAYFTQKTSTIWYGIAVLGSDHNKFERINSHHNGHGMVIRDESNHNLVLNCDFHHNYDPISSSPYGDADGLEVAYLSSSMENTIKGCRLWNNSDDGVDLWNNNGNLILDGCWSWRNGYREDGKTAGGDGGGFKFGSTTTTNGSEFKRRVTNNLSVYNRTRGYNQNAANVKFYFYNNIAYKNPYGIVFPSYNLAHIFRNNIVFENNQNWNGSYSNAIKDHNSYDSGLPSSGPVASSSDFLSLDTTGLSKPRQANGSMPAINFMKLASGSDLIDAGVNVGISYAGSSPDLGPFELQKAASTPTSKLAFVSSVVKSTSPSDVEISYNLTLSTTQPAPSCFEVKVNTAVRTIQNLRLSGKNVYLTLASPLLAGDVVTLSYFKPSANPLQCTGGTQAESISAKTVLNSVEAATPVYVSSVVEDATPSKIEMTYDIKLASILPPTSAFVLKVNGKTISIKAVAITGNKVNLTLSSELLKNDTITLAYIAPSTNPLQTSLGGKAVTIGDKPVANNILGISTMTERFVNDGKITIFPNPAKNFISIANFNPVINGEEVPILKIYDFAGKLCQEIKIEDTGEIRNIPIELKSGLYITQLVIGKVIYHSQKLIVISR